MFGYAFFTKCFPVQQKNKVRPIDGCKASMVNHVAPTEGPTVHSMDHIASMVAYWLKAGKDKSARLDFMPTNKSFCLMTLMRETLFSLYSNLKPRLRESSRNVSCHSGP